MSIKQWAAEDRPREKLLQKGSYALSDAELIALLIGSGTASLSAVDVARKLLTTVGHDLNALAHLTAHDLMKIKGVGEAKALAILSALELGRRRKGAELVEKPKVTSSGEAFELIRPDLMDLPHEEFWLLMLNRANRLIRKQRVSHGGVGGTVADPKVIFKSAVAELATGIIVAHNHPSGNLTASQADIDLTRKLKEAARLLDMNLLDHLIVSGERYYSFADEGLL